MNSSNNTSSAQLPAPQIEPLESRIAPAVIFVTNTGDSGTGSLRQAVITANGTPGADTIVFKAGGIGHITLTSGEIGITAPLTINGAGKVTVDGDANSRIFDVYSTANSVTLTGLTLVNGTGAGTQESGRGGAVFAQDASLIVKNSVVTGNNATDSGGGIYANANGVGQTVTLVNTKLVGNTSQKEGGGLYARAKGPIKIINSTIAGNTSAEQGAGFYNDGDSTESGLIQGSVITGNISSTAAGGVYWDEGPLTVVKSSITANQATSGNGGGLYLESGNAVKIASSLIANNTASGSGGGIQNKGILTLAGTKVSQNVAGSGGGLYTTGANAIKVTGSTFAGNTATGSGGGILALGGAQLTLSSDSFLNNSATAEGGGIDTGGTGTSAVPLKVTGTTFASNHAVAGGGIYANGDGTVTIVSSKFTANVATTSGGGVFLDSSVGIEKVIASSFSGNTASTDGGGLEMDGDVAKTILASQIHSNFAGGSSSDEGGGGLLFEGSTGPMKIVGSTISGNQTDRWGGGIYDFDHASLTLIATKVVNNVAANDGGGIYVFEGSTGALTETASSVTGNSAPSDPNVN